MKSSAFYRIRCVLWILVLFSPTAILAEDGYRLWLRYDKVEQNDLLEHYSKNATEIVSQQSCPILSAASEELQRGFNGLIGNNTPLSTAVSKSGAIIIGTPEESSIVNQLVPKDRLTSAGPEGYIIQSVRYKNYRVTVIAANEPRGVLYGTFKFLRLLQTGRNIGKGPFSMDATDAKEDHGALFCIHSMP